MAFLINGHGRELNVLAIFKPTAITTPPFAVFLVTMFFILSNASQVLVHPYVHPFCDLFENLTCLFQEAYRTSLEKTSTLYRAFWN